MEANKNTYETTNLVEESLRYKKKLKTRVKLLGVSNLLLVLSSIVLILYLSRIWLEVVTICMLLSGVLLLFTLRYSKKLYDFNILSNHDLLLFDFKTGGVIDVKRQPHNIAEVENGVRQDGVIFSKEEERLQESINKEQEGTIKILDKETIQTELVGKYTIE